MASDSVRRIMAEVKELSKLNNTPNTFFHAAPLESDLFEWHFTVRGPPDTPFEEGIYHGRIVLPAEYPLKPPEIILLTPNGRFETGKRICLSVTAHHQETWQPSWGIRTIITALVGFMPSRAEGVGALDYPDDHRRMLARRSVGFKCDRCGVCPAEQLKPRKLYRLGGGEGAAQPAQGGAQSAAQSAKPKVHQQPVVQEQSAAQQEESRTVQRATNQPAAVTPPASASSPASASPPASAPRVQQDTQERELLYLAYAIAAVMVAIIVRRLFKFAN